MYNPTRRGRALRASIHCDKDREPSRGQGRKPAEPVRPPAEMKPYQVAMIHWPIRRARMEYPVTGLHHITLCAGGAQDDVDFFTGVVGQRLIKQTVLFDGRYAHYHLYYANAGAEPGSVTTSFPYNRVPGRQGSGQIEATV